MQVRHGMGARPSMGGCLAPGTPRPSPGLPMHCCPHRCSSMPLDISSPSPTIKAPCKSPGTRLLFHNVGHERTARQHQAAQRARSGAQHRVVAGGRKSVAEQPHQLCQPRRALAKHLALRQLINGRHAAHALVLVRAAGGGGSCSLRRYGMVASKVWSAVSEVGPQTGRRQQQQLILQHRQASAPLLPAPTKHTRVRVLCACAPLQQ